MRQPGLVKWLSLALNDEPGPLSLPFVRGTYPCFLPWEDIPEPSRHHRPQTERLITNNNHRT
uniref:Uncharacterized protein n=1 Tax=Picea glauca TaxID=3330 RepID=A0A101M0J6_PICGL|nr:hypothetical protein ABT39_MTgene4729 [Picea glauca]